MTRSDHRSHPQHPRRTRTLRPLGRPLHGSRALGALTAALLGWAMVGPQLASANGLQAADGQDVVNPAEEIHGDELYQPSLGQEGKDVIWIPTPDALIQAMLDIVNIQPDDILYDLGSGDGKIVIAATQRYNINAVGIEYNQDLVSLARRNADRAGVGDRARFIHGDIFKEDFSSASVLALYLLPNLNLSLKPTILAMRPGTRVVSNSFDMGSWPPDATIELEPSKRAYYWVVPAKAQGRWRLADPTGTARAELELRQDFQLLNGTMRVGSEQFTIIAGRMLGEAITFSYGRSTAAGSTELGRFEGTVQAGRLSGRLSPAGTASQILNGERLEPGQAKKP
jgi:hypothetical protein